MGKEVKIGLAVIGVLLCAFGGVLAMRLKRERPANALEKVAAAEKEGKIGKKKKTTKKGENDNTGGSARSEPSASSPSAELEPPLSSRSRRDLSNAADVKIDRYGRPLGNDGAPPDESEPGEEVTANQNPPVDLLSPNQNDTRADDRYARYTERDSLQSQPLAGGVMPVEEPAQDDASPPADRFAQAPRGLSFSDDEPADGMNAPADDRSAGSPRGLSFSDDEPADGMNAPTDDRSAGSPGGLPLSGDEPADGTDAPADDAGLDAPAGAAPDLMAAPGSNGFDFDNQPVGSLKEAADPRADTNRDDAGLDVALTPDDKPRDFAAPTNDRFADSRGDLADRYSDRQGEPAMPPDEEPLAVAPAVGGSPAAETPEGWQEPANGGSYTVEANDNFWRISQKVYGTGAYFKALEAHNGRQLGNRAILNVGDVVSTPPSGDLRRDYPDLSPKPRGVPPGRRGAALAGTRSAGGRAYTVLEGDTLFDIARQELGKASRWAEIYELNRDRLGEDFNYLSPGMRLVLPSRTDRDAPLATRPARNGYRR